ncbi:DUF4124 domain-containing protein [Thermomonas hydrothermalis]|uniref:DUF4124 domain-containing protein n=1 Tax=Thermomonas hydrothermalis TaxID=213588 RepID=A0A1M4VPS5_9GAMM|nr:DUF4124 domain-containing protein [Thermomonas hydrothermalis]MCL6619983.1 DUF4124 domain-containing protein [Thermomonas hydrothermalis]SHE70850.1 protein of unknown function [Thermomonas hydrothermalis]
MRPVHLVSALIMTCLAVPVLAQQSQRVYQWKDANGVTHYTDTPPAARHTTRDIDVRTGTPAASTAKQPESEQCTNARANLKRLQSGEPIGIDTNGDGKPDRNLSTDERKAQTELNAAAVKAFCPPASP